MTRLWEYRGTSLIRNRTPLGPYCRPMPRALKESRGGGLFLWVRYPCSVGRTFSLSHTGYGVQGYLAHMTPPPQNLHRALGIVLL